jgi:thioredoxin 1
MPIVTEINKLADFNAILTQSQGLVILKLGATWCGPCQKIAGQVHAAFNTITATYGDKVVCCDIDVDESFELYAFLKNKKMVNGIPVILLYKKGNVNFFPDDSITGADPAELDKFFKRCGLHLRSLAVALSVRDQR